MLAAQLRHFACTMAMAWFALGVSAQSPGTGALVGTVTDASRAVVRGVAVTLTSAETGYGRATFTDADGAYRFGLLPPGAYRLRFEAPGFRIVEAAELRVGVTETLVL